MSFGRKGLAPGQAAPAAAGGFGRAPQAAVAGAQPQPQPSEEEDKIAAAREAFIASERARRAQEEIGEGSLPFGGDPLADLRNGSQPVAARPAKSMGLGPVGQSGLPVDQEDQIRAAARGMSGGQPSAPVSYGAGAGRASRAKKSYFFGDPAGRSLGIAYLIWFVIGQTGLHRVYCGQKESAIYQVALLIVSVVTLFIFPPLGMVGFVAWICWLIGDLFMMPGMLRKFKAEHDYSHAFE